ncbi:helix-turn-helix transcriptional regulator [Bengtsoniella intestinalis]|uniref:helix-turn-helix domain-containing protein n=1 Tax=Bengtsoniella intestinalis TaxID=3073143 RepID=UPI00391F4F88
MNDFENELDKLLKAVEVSPNILEHPPVREYDIAQELREMIIERRTESGITQIQLAEKSGVSQANISKIENGVSLPSVATLKKLADALDYRLVIDFIPEEDVL